MVIFEVQLLWEKRRNDYEDQNILVGRHYYRVDGGF